MATRTLILMGTDTRSSLRILFGLTCSLWIAGCGDSSKVTSEDKVAAGPPPSYDVQLDQVTDQGCLNLPRVFNMLRALPQNAVLRRHTSDFHLAKANGEKQAPRAKFSAVSAFAHFVFRESDALSAMASLPTVEQTDCATVRFKSDIEGDRDFKVTDFDSAGRLVLKDKDGKQEIFELTGARELRHKTSETTIDFCPDHSKAVASTTQVFSWGPANELAEKPAEVSRSYIKSMALVLNAFPPELTQLTLSDSAGNENVATPTESLEALARAALEPDAQACPHVVKPPAGDEAAAPEDEATPETPRPSPTPAPTGEADPRTPDEPLPPPVPAPTPRVLPVPFGPSAPH